MTGNKQAGLFDEHWERPEGAMRLRTAATEGYSLDSIALHLGACRRASLYLRSAGVISEQEHAAIMRTLNTYEENLQEQAREAAQ
jgi:hypothetical protein